MLLTLRLGLNMNLLKWGLRCFNQQRKFESEKNYRTLLETIQDGVLVIQDEKFVYVNDALCEIFETTRDKLLGANVFKALEVHPDDEERLHSNYYNRLRKDKTVPSVYEFRLYMPNGKMKYLNLTAGLGLYEGRVASMGTLRDVTKKHIIDTRLNTLKNAVKHSPAGVVITDVNGTIEYINPKFSDITGYSVSEVLGQTPRILNSGYHDEEFYEKLWARIMSGRIWKGEILNKKKNGELYWEQQSISAIIDDESGNITHFVGIKEDVTEWKHLKTSLVEAKEKAEESDNLKTAFLASMSHEIRTPMNAIIGFTDLLRDEDMSQQLREKYTDYISTAGDTLLHLIDDIIDIAKIEAGQMKISTNTCDLSELMDNVYTTHLEQKSRNSKDHIEIIPNGDNVNERLVIKTDCHRLTQILNNIVGNALKFTEEGYVKFGYLTVSDSILQFYVKDTGIGIPSNEINHIFDRFRRVENDEKIYSGTGLGLAITKTLVELLGGKIWVESTEDVGTIFYFTIKYEKISKTAKKKTTKIPKENYTWHDKTILIAEDEKLNYTYLAEVLAKTGATLLWAKTGNHAITLYEKHKERINVILMDIKMPDLSGYDAMKAIRQTSPDVPLIVQTAHVISGERDKSIAAGCNEYLTKPIKHTTLLNTIAKYIDYEA